MHKNRLIRSVKEWDALLAELEQHHVISFDTEYESRGWPRVKPCGFSISWRVRKNQFKSVYVPLNHEHSIKEPAPGNPKRVIWRRMEWQLTPDHVRPGLEKLVNGNRLIVMHNVQADLKLLHVLGVKTSRIRVFDTMIAAWLIDSDTEHGLKPLTLKIFGHKMNDIVALAPAEVVEDRSKPRLKSGPRKGLYRVKKTGVPLVARVPMPAIQKYAGEDAYYTLRLYMGFRKKLKREKMYRLFNELLMEDLLYLNEMEETGMVIDRRYLKKFNKKLKKRIDKFKKRIYHMRPGQNRDVAFNIGSTNQLNLVLFGVVPDVVSDEKRPRAYDKTWTTARKKRWREKHEHFEPKYVPDECEFGVEPLGDPGKSGLFSTKSDNLKRLAHDGHHVCKLISEVNHMEHLVAMVNGWLKRAVHLPDGTWRLFGTFNMHGTRTGRLSSKDPNLQNIPTRDLRYPIRVAFIAPRGYRFADADYSQIELKLLAHFSGDKRMMRIFLQDGDLHSESAKIVYKIEVPKGMTLAEEGKWIKKHFEEERGKSKTMNFSIIYGAGPLTVAIKNEIPLPEAKRLHQYHPKTFPGAHRWMRSRERFCAKHGFVRTLFKRKRHLPDAKLNPYDFPRGSDKQRKAFINRSAAFRRAVNTPVQGSAADIILLAMRNVRRYWMKRGEWMVTIFPTCQVHDELAFYFTSDRADEYLAKTIEIMKKAYRLKVPVDAEGSTGANWKEAK